MHSNGGTVNLNVSNDLELTKCQCSETNAAPNWNSAPIIAIFRLIFDLLRFSAANCSSAISSNKFSTI